MRIILEKRGLNSWDVFEVEGENDIDRREYGVEHKRILYSNLSLPKALKKLELSLRKKVQIKQLNLFEEVKNA
jgi:hypothetical protein